MNTDRNQLSVDDEALSGISRGALPGSRKVYLQGRRFPDMRVPMREISLEPTRGTPNTPLLVYDTSGPYTDERADLDVRAGLRPLRERWIEELGRDPTHTN